MYLETNVFLDVKNAVYKYNFEHTEKSVVRTWTKDVVESGYMLDQSKRRSKGNMDVVTT